MKIDHIGIAVRSVEKAVEHWEKAFGYRQSTEIVVNTRQKARVVFVEKEGSMTIKFIQPTDRTSPLVESLKKGGGLHHLCFKCDKLDTQLSTLEEMGMRVLVPPQPGEAFDNENIAFVFAGNGLNIEVIDTDKRAGRRKE